VHRKRGSLVPVRNILKTCEECYHIIPERELFLAFEHATPVVLPYGNMEHPVMKYSPKTSDESSVKPQEVGRHTKRPSSHFRYGLRFVIELEKGKPTCEIGKALTVVQDTRHSHRLTPPSAAKES